MASNVHRAIVVEKRLCAADIFVFTLALDPPAPLAFRPGQFISVRVGEEPNGSAILRSYSLASSPGRSEIQLLVKRVEAGSGSAWFMNLAVGETVTFTGPMGFFVLDLQHPGDIVFAATGVGIAPVLPMLDEALGRNESGRIVLYWGNRYQRDLFWQRELDARINNPRLQVRRFLSSDDPTWTGERGRITSAIAADLASLLQPTFYLVGNGGMIRDVKQELVARGVDRKRQIRNEVFFE